MKSEPAWPDFSFNEYAGESKAKQIAALIEHAIYTGSIMSGNRLPPVTKGVKQFGVAIKTVVKAYHHLIEKRAVKSKSRQGYFILNNRSKARVSSLLLIQCFNPQLQFLYEEFSLRRKKK